MTDEFNNENLNTEGSDTSAPEQPVGEDSVDSSKDDRDAWKETLERISRDDGYYTSGREENSFAINEGDMSKSVNPFGDSGTSDSSADEDGVTAQPPEPPSYAPPDEPISRESEPPANIPQGYPGHQNNYQAAQENVGYNAPYTSPDKNEYSRPYSEHPFPNTPDNVPPPMGNYGYNPYPPNQMYPGPYVQPQYPNSGPYFYPQMNQKKKFSTGLKVFLWIVIILSLFTIFGFILFSVNRFSGVQQDNSSMQGMPNVPGYDNYDNYGIPDFPSESSEEESADPVDLPDIEVIPNKGGIVINPRPNTEELNAKEVYEKVAKSTVAVTASRTGTFDEETSSTGTGIIATSDGYIITNSHVVGDSKSTYVKITTFDEKEYDAIVVGVDRTTDLAVLKTNDYKFTPAELGDADDLYIGEWVIAIGNPGGARFSSSMTRGIISGLNRTVGNYSDKGMTYIQTDAAINPGNSGGPLVNMYGQVIGINSSKIITAGYEGMGFAIPVSKAKTIIDELLSEGYISGRVRIGIKGSDVTSTQNSFYNLPYGFMIMEIDEDSTLYGTEAKEGDIIIAIDGQEVDSLSDISGLLLDYSPGDSIELTIYSAVDGSEYKVSITLLADNGETQK